MVHVQFNLCVRFFIDLQESLAELQRMVIGIVRVIATDMEDSIRPEHGRLVNEEVEEHDVHAESEDSDA